RVFVAEYNRISTCSGSNCSSLTDYLAPSASTQDIVGMVSSGSKVFWATDQKFLYSCDVGAVCSQPAQLLGPASVEAIPAGLATQGGNLYASTVSGTIFTCAEAMCGSTLRTVVATNDVIVGAPAVDETAIYWVARQPIDADGGPQPFRLMRLAKPA